MTQRLGVPPALDTVAVRAPNPWLHIPGVVTSPQTGLTNQTVGTTSPPPTEQQTRNLRAGQASSSAGPYLTGTAQQTEPPATTWPHRAHPPLCNKAGSRWGKAPLQCHCWAWGPWLRSAPQGSYSTLNSARCSDGSFLTTTEGQPTLCAYWRPGLTNGHEKGFFKGAIHNIFSIKEEGTHELTVFMVTCFPSLDTEAVHFVGSLDVYGPIHDNQDHVRLLSILHQEDRSHRHPEMNREEAPDDDEHTPTSPA